MDFLVRTAQLFVCTFAIFGIVERFLGGCPRATPRRTAHVKFANMDAVPLIDAQTAAILGSVDKFAIQQHVKWLDNCVGT